MATALPTSEGLWLGSWQRVEWLMWAVYLFVPIAITAFLTPVDGWASGGELFGEYLCNLTGTACTTGVAHTFYALASKRLRFRRELPRIFVHALVGLGAVLIGTELAMLVEVHRHPGWAVDAMRITSYKHSFPLAFGIIMVALVVDRLTARARDLELERAEAERDRLAARLAALQSQTDPHFLFNVLNTLAELVHDDPDKAEFVIERLANVFRHTLEHNETALVELRRELGVVRDYLSIEEVRFGDRLRWDVTCPESLEAALVPALSVQPLVENAVKHGARGSGVNIVVSVASPSGRLEVTVVDDGPGPGASTHRGTRTSATNLRQRLGLLYDGDASYTIAPGEGGGTVAALSLPLEHR